MKKIDLIFAVLLVCICYKTKAQNISSFEMALSKAQTTQKPIWIFVQSKDCNMCNEVGLAGLMKDTEMKNMLEEKYVYYVSKGVPDALQTHTEAFYFPKKFFGMIILNDAGYITNVENGTKSEKGYYALIAKNLLDKPISEQNKLANLLLDYQNNKQFKQAYALLQGILQLSIEPTTDLLTNIITLAPEDSAKSFTFLQFIAKAAPKFQSPASEYMYKDITFFNKIWYQLPLQNRIAINGRIINKSIEEAISDTNTAYAIQVAQFARETFAPQREAGEKKFDELLIQYYFGIGDSTEFLKRADRYYNHYYTNATIDSLHKLDSIYTANQQNKLLENIKNQLTKEQQEKGNFFIKRKFVLSPLSTQIANELNNGAWQVYKITNNAFYLDKALKWCEQSIKAALTPENADTYAHILYQLGQKEAAITWEKTAIEEAKKIHIESLRFENTLYKIEKNEALIKE